MTAQKTYTKISGQKYWTSHCIFNGEPKLLLKQEVREPALYNSIIEAIATGNSKLNEIKVGVDTGKCAKYISLLIDLKILEKIAPLKLEAKIRKSIYRIKE